MLDIGCGGGATLKRLLKRSRGAKVYGIDISEESVAKAIKVNADVIDKQVFVQQGSAAELPYEDRTFDLVTAVETVYFWPNLTQAPLTNWGLGLIEFQDGWTMLDDAGFVQTEIHRRKPSYATILGVKP